MEPPEHEPAEEEPPESTPESLYEELVFRPTFEAYSHKFDEAGLTPSQRAEVYQRALLNGIEFQIQKPILRSLFGKDFFKMNQQKKKEVMETPEFQQACEKKVREVKAKSSEAVYTQSIIDTIIKKVKGPQK